MPTVRPLFNLNLRDKWEGYRAGDPLVRSKFDLFSRAETAIEAAEEAFAYFNADTRPNGADEPSLSVGDVVCVLVAGNERVYFACATSGWKYVRADVVEAFTLPSLKSFAWYADTVAEAIYQRS